MVLWGEQGWLLLSAALMGALLDRWLGEPRRWHPLVGFGLVAQHLVAKLHPVTEPQQVRPSLSGVDLRVRGFFAWLLLVLPLPVGVIFLQNCWSPQSSLLALAFQFGMCALLVYLCIGLQSLKEHIIAVAEPLQNDDLPEARLAVGRIVSRDTQNLTTDQVCKAGVESALENGSDAVFAPLFWFFVAGPAALVLYRCANTLDAMWGYRTERWQDFGCWSARADDVLNVIPARLTALAYALLGNTRSALFCWRHQARSCSSPNGGPVMCSGAGSLGVTLGGGASYHGQFRPGPVMGQGPKPEVSDLLRSLRLLDRTLLVWLLCAGVVVIT